MGLVSIVWAEEAPLKLPETAEEIEEFFLKAKPQTDFEINHSVGKRKSLSRIVDDDEVVAKLPRVGALVHFDFGSARIKQDSYSLLRQFAIALRRKLKNALVIIAGHTDSKGSASYNWKLSKRRAEAVKDFLVFSHGIDPERLFVKAYGENKPLAGNDTDSGRALNRRVEFTCLW
jgi:outer membrane protein OmpA-like peptidoglycan-associated protein